jgi:hypothetical protein
MLKAHPEKWIPVFGKDDGLKQHFGDESPMPIFYRSYVTLRSIQRSATA